MTSPASAIEALLALMARLRDREHGCPWDLAQSFATIAPYTIEEAYEVADAIESAEPQRLRDELGDLLFQVVFHARMAQERGWFDFSDVAQGIHAKLVRRHPHVFAAGGVAAAQAVAASEDLPRAALAAQWEAHKERERSAAARERGEAAGTLAGIPLALPALTRAAKLGKRAGLVGFDWSSAADVRAKLTEELAELDEALVGSAPASPPAAVVEELGDLLFAIANYGRHLHVDAESALRAANAKFARRFARMERLAGERGRALTTLSAAEWDSLWREAKLSDSD